MKRNYFLLLSIAIAIIAIACGTNGDTNENILSSEDVINADNPKNPSSTLSCGIEIFSHSVVYYPDFLVPPKEFDADVTLNMNLGIYLPSEVTVKRQIKVDDGPWYPWHNWGGYWDEAGGNYTLEASTDGLYDTTYHHRVKVVVNSTGQSSPVYEFSLYYNNFINP